MEKINDALTELALCCDEGDKTVKLFAALVDGIRELKTEFADLQVKVETMRAASFTGILDDVMARHPAAPTPPAGASVEYRSTMPDMIPLAKTE